MFEEALRGFVPDDYNGHDEAIAESFPASDPPSVEPGHTTPQAHSEHAEPIAVKDATSSVPVTMDGELRARPRRRVIAAITSCTNTSNPS